MPTVLPLVCTVLCVPQIQSLLPMSACTGSVLDVFIRVRWPPATWLCARTCVRLSGSDPASKSIHECFLCQFSVLSIARCFRLHGMNKKSKLCSGFADSPLSVTGVNQAKAFSAFLLGVFLFFL